MDESKLDPELQTAYSQGGGAEGPGALRPKAEGLEVSEHQTKFLKVLEYQKVFILHIKEIAPHLE